MSESRHYLISGKVQGVAYRYSCQKQALELGVRGWVRNLEDGRVEVAACGSEAELAAFEQWLREGPEPARVKDLEITPQEPQDWAGFEIR